MDAPLAALDLAIVMLAYLLPLVLRFDGAVPERYWSDFREFAPLAAVIHLGVNAGSGLYGQMWRYASAQEARRLTMASLVSGTLVVLVSEVLGGAGRALPLSVTLFGTALALIGFGAVRFHSRLFAVKRRVAVRPTTRLLVVGAGQAGAMLAHDMLVTRPGELAPIGFVDDDPRKVGRAIHGIPILGGLTDLPHLLAAKDVDQVVLAIPSATAALVRQVSAACEEALVTLRVLPPVRELVLHDGRVSVRDLRDLQIEDLLFRDEVRTDLAAVRALLHGRRVLITGAGGSIGSEIARQVAAFGPSCLLLLDHDETHLHDLVLGFGVTVPATPVLADVRDHARIRQVFLQTRPEVVFHAAAHKHVPILEHQPVEALLTNVVGTAHVVDAARSAGVARLVHISTDKAIRPASVMGASKWLAEQVVRTVDGQGGVMCAVRFGNVLGSRGSVIPTFLRQIERGGPVTVTDPAMVRYFMSIREAVQLVLQSAALARGGEVFTLDMGEPVPIIELARRLIRLAGHVPGRDIDIRITGARPGEKLVEEIVDAGEEQVPSSHPSIAVCLPPVPDMGSLRRVLRELEAIAREGDPQRLAERMVTVANHGLVPVTVDPVARDRDAAVVA